MEGYTRKLAMWYTRTFKPIMTHDELEPIMATLGFVALPPAKDDDTAVVWKEYVYTARGGGGGGGDGERLPRPRLTYPRVDGLHIYTYRAFIDAVNFYLEMCDFSDLFHIRGMPLHRGHDRNQKLRRMQEDDSVFVFREGTLEQSIYNLYHFDKNDDNINNNNKSEDYDYVHSSVGIRAKGNDDNSYSDCRFVPLKDLVPSSVVSWRNIEPMD